MCFDYGFALFDGYVLREQVYFQTDVTVCQVLEEKWQNCSREIQQQMQDNIQWIKAGK
jgi:hypothetical protein